MDGQKGRGTFRELGAKKLEQYRQGKHKPGSSRSNTDGQSAGKQAGSNTSGSASETGREGPQPVAVSTRKNGSPLFHQVGMSASSSASSLASMSSSQQAKSGAHASESSGDAAGGAPGLTKTAHTTLALPETVVMAPRQVVSPAPGVQGSSGAHSGEASAVKTPRGPASTLSTATPNSPRAANASAKVASHDSNQPNQMPAAANDGGSATKFMQAELASMRLRLQQAEARNGELTAQLSSVRSELNVAKSAHVAHTPAPPASHSRLNMDYVGSVEARLAECEESLESALTQESQLQASLQDKQRIVEATQQALQESESKVQELQLALRDQAQVNKESEQAWHQQVQELQQKLAACELELAASQHAASELQLSKLELQGLRDEKDEVLRANEDLQLHVEQLSRELADTQQALHEANIGMGHVQEATLKAVMDTVQAQLDDSQREIIRLQAQLQESAQDIATRGSQAQQLSQQLHQYLEEYQHADGQAAGHAKEQLTVAVQCIDELSGMAGALQAKLDAAQQAVDVQGQVHASEMSQLQKSLAVLDPAQLATPGVSPAKGAMTRLLSPTSGGSSPDISAPCTQGVSDGAAGVGDSHGNAIAFTASSVDQLQHQIQDLRTKLKAAIKKGKGFEGDKVALEAERDAWLAERTQLLADKGIWAAERSRLEADVERLTAEQSRLEAEGITLAAGKHSVEQTCADLQDAVTDLEKKVQEAEVKLKEAEQNANGRVKEVDVMKAALLKLAQQLQTQLARTENTTNVALKVAGDIHDIQVLQVRYQDVHYKELYKDATLLKEQKEATLATVSSIKLEKEQLEQQVTELRTQVSTKEEQVSTLKTQSSVIIQEKESTVAELQARVVELSAQTHQLQRDHQIATHALQAKLDLAVAEADQCRLHHHDLQVLVKDLTSQLATREAVVSDMQAQHAQHEVSMQQMQAKLDLAISEATSIEIELKMVKDQLAAALSDLEQASQSTSDQVQQLRSEITKKDAEISSLKDSVATHMSLAQTSAGQYAAVTQQLAELNEELVEKTQQAQHAAQVLAGKEQELVSLSQRLHDATSELHAAHAASVEVSDKLQQALAAAQAECAALQKALGDAKGEADALRGAVASAQDECQQLKAASEQGTQEINNLHGALTAAQEESKSLKEALENMQESANASASAHEALRVQYDQLAEAQHELQQSATRYADECAELDVAVKMKSEQVSELETALQAKCDALRESQQQYQILTEQHHVLEEAYEKNTQVHSDLVAQVQANKELQQQLDLLHQKISEQHDALMSARRDLDLVRGSQEEVSQQLQARVSELESSLQGSEVRANIAERQLKHALQEMTAAVSTHQAAAQQDVAAASDVADQLCALCQSLATQQADAQQTIRAMTQQVGVLEERVSGLESQLVEASEQAQRAHDQSVHESTRAQGAEERLQEAELQLSEFSSQLAAASHQVMELQAAVDSKDQQIVATAAQHVAELESLRSQLEAAKPAAEQHTNNDSRRGSAGGVSVDGSRCDSSPGYDSQPVTATGPNTTSTSVSHEDVASPEAFTQLSQQVQALTKERDTFASRLRGAVKKGKAFEAESQAKTKQIEELQQQLATLQAADSHDSSSSEALEHLQGEVTAAQARIAELESQLASLQQDLQKATAERETALAKASEAAELERAVLEAQEQISLLKQHNSKDLSEQRDIGHDAQASEVQLSIFETAGPGWDVDENEFLPLPPKASVSSNLSARNSMVTVENKVNAAAASNTEQQLQQQVKHLQEQLEVVQHQLQMTVASLQDAQVAVEDKESALQAAQAAVQAKEAEVADFKERLRAAIRRGKRLESELKEIKDVMGVASPTRSTIDGFATPRETFESVASPSPAREQQYAAGSVEDHASAVAAAAAAVQADLERERSRAAEHESQAKELAEKVSALEAKLAVAEQRVSLAQQLTSHAEDLSVKMNQLQAQLESATSTAALVPGLQQANASLQQQLEEAGLKVQALEGQLEDSREQLEMASRKYAAIKESLEESSRKLSEVDTLSKRNAELELSLVQSSSVARQLQDTIDTLQQQLAEQQAAAQGQLAGLEALLAGLKADIESERSAAGQLSEQVAELQQALTESRTSLLDIQNQHADSQRQYEVVLSRSQIAGQEAERAKQEAQEMAEQVSELRQQLSEAQAAVLTLPDLRRRAEQGGRVVVDLQRQLREVQAENETLQGELLGLRIQAQLESNRQSTRQQKGTGSQSGQDELGHLSAARGSNSGWSQDDLTQTLQQRSSGQIAEPGPSTQELEAQHTQHVNEIQTQHAQQLADLQAKIDQLAQELLASQQAAVSASKSQQALDGELHDTRQRLHDAEATAAETRAEVAAVSAALQSEQAGKAELEWKFDELAAEIESLQEQNQELELKLKTLQQQQQETPSASEAPNAGTLSSELQSSVAKLQTQVAEVLVAAELPGLLRADVTDMAACEQVLESCTTGLASLSSCVVDMKQMCGQVSQLQQTLNTTQAQYSELQTMFNDMQKQQQQQSRAAAAAGTPFSATPPPAGRRPSGTMTSVPDQLQLPVSVAPGGLQEDGSSRGLTTSGSTDALMMPKTQSGQPVHRAKAATVSSPQTAAARRGAAGEGGSSSGTGPRTSGAGPSSYDIESGLPTRTSGEGGSSDQFLLNDDDSKRASYVVGQFMQLTSWPPVRMAHPHVRTAAALLDKGWNIATSFLSQHPDFRLTAVAYLVLVHLMLWAQLASRHPQCPTIAPAP